MTPVADESVVPIQSGSRWKRNLVGLIISVACLAMVAWRINLDDVLHALYAFRWETLLVGVASLAVGYSARIVRWSILLQATGAQVPPIRCAAPFLGSIALNNVLPMRLGDVVRAMVFPGAIGVGRIPATASLVMERLVDMMTLLASLALGLAVTASARLPEWLVGTTVVLTVTGGASLLGVFFFSGVLARWLGRLAGAREATGLGRVLAALANLLTGFESMSRLPVLMALFALSMVVWAGEAGLFWSLLWGFGLQSSAGAAVTVMAVTTLSTLVPSSPGYVGPFHLAAFSAIAMLGGSSSQAASYAVLAHLAVWLPTTVAGAIAILFNPQLFGRARAMA